MSDPLTPLAAGGSPPQMLTYDGYVPIKDSRSRRLLFGYWLGAMSAGLLYGAIIIPILLVRRPDVVVGALIEGFVLSVGFAIVFLLPDTLFLSLTIWLRTKILKQVRFARFRTAFYTGFVGGLYPLGILQALGFSETTSLIFFFCCLGWHVLYASAAGFWLCYRSNLRG